MWPSYVHGASGTPLLGQTIGENLDRAVERWGDREALVSCHQDVRYTYAELGEAVDRLARALLAEGVRPGDRLGIWSPNCAEWVLVQYATTANMPAVRLAAKPTEVVRGSSIAPRNGSSGSPTRPVAPGSARWSGWSSR